ncbi:response regulator [bacterium]|nr:response regulator [bacterium]
MAKILIVDDEKDLAGILGIILKQEGYQVTPVLDGYQALEEIKKTPYDLILMDIRLPGINGVETFIQIKEINPEVRVIMMTGFAMEDLIEEALAKGAYACIHKPFDPVKLIELIQKVLSQDKKVVLIANGDNKTRKEVEVSLSEKGYRIYFAQGKDEMLAKLKVNHYDCILLNLSLPGINGLAILRKVKQVSPDAVVIIMTDYDLPEMVRKAKKLSTYACIKKPINIDELIKLLQEIKL